MVDFCRLVLPTNSSEYVQRDEYLKLAAVEDEMWYFQALHAHFYHELRRRFDPEAGIRILDAGCGTGGLIRRLRARTPRWAWEGVDMSSLACELARERTGVPVAEGSLTALPFADGSFDAVVIADVLQQLVSPLDGLRQARRVLKPGGVLVFNVAAYRWLWSYHDDTCQTQHRFTRREVIELLKRADLQSVRSSYRNMLLLPLVVLKRKVFKQPGGSDVRPYGRTANALLRRVLEIEDKWARSVTPLPWGSSIFVSAVRPA